MTPDAITPHELLTLFDVASAAQRGALATMSTAERRARTERAGQYQLDLVAEAAILPVLASAGVRVLSEESGWSGPADAPFTVVVDPVDGSTNCAAPAAVLGHLTVRARRRRPAVRARAERRHRRALRRDPREGRDPRRRATHAVERGGPRAGGDRAVRVDRNPARLAPIPCPRIGGAGAVRRRRGPSRRLRRRLRRPARAVGLPGRNAGVRGSRSLDRGPTTPRPRGRRCRRRAVSSSPRGRPSCSRP